MGKPQWLSSKERACNTVDMGDEGSVLGLEGSPEGGNSNPLQYSCLKKPWTKGAWPATVHRVAKSWTWLSMYRHYIGEHKPPIITSDYF